MAKKTRIDRRGKIRPLVKPKRPAQPHHWMKAKAIGMYLNRRQYVPPPEIFSMVTNTDDNLVTSDGDFFIAEI